MRDREILKSFIPLVNFIAGIMGPETEVVLHDLSNPESSVISIQNGHLSGRNVGSPPTDLVLRVMQDKSVQNQDYLLNYRAAGIGNGIFRSSSYFIKNPKGKLIGVLCVNTETSLYIKMHDYLDSYLSFLNNGAPTEAGNSLVPEKLENDPAQIIKGIITESLASFTVPPERMSQEEKIKVTRALHNKGMFLLKGSIQEAARVLFVSEPTMYRYIKK